jgi:hypothetical protein
LKNNLCFCVFGGLAKASAPITIPCRFCTLQGMNNQQPAGFGQLSIYGIFAVIAYFSCCMIALLLGGAALVFLVFLSVIDTQGSPASMWIYLGFFAPLIIFILTIALIYWAPLFNSPVWLKIC